MPFPIYPAHGEDESLFLIQDPTGLRTFIVPIVEIAQASGLANGLGTAFVIHPTGRALTAQHVLERYLETQRKQLYLPYVILSPGLIYGAHRMPDHCFSGVIQAYSYRKSIEDPMGDLQGKIPKTSNIFDAMKLKLLLPPNLPKWLLGWLALPQEPPDIKVGDKVMAIGYPEINFIDQGLDRLQRYTEAMYGSLGEITELHPHGRLNRPWPAFQVNAHWPSGMSGGPILHESGVIIGLVSSSEEKVKDDNFSYAVWFLKGFADWANTGEDNKAPL